MGLFNFFVFLTVLTIVITSALGIYLNNSSNSKTPNSAAIWTETSEIWGPILEDWTIGDHNHRESRVTQLIPIQTALAPNASANDEKESKITQGIKIVNNAIGTKIPPPSGPPQRRVTETDMYLLGAIEKLVYRVDFMEKRLRRVEEMLYYAMAGSKVDQEPCPENFSRAGTNCYLFAGTAGRELDWKAANKQCKKLGAVLAEMETIEENQDIVYLIQNHNYLKGRDYWTGGLNPGLLWIWSNTARPVKAENENKDTYTGAEIAGNGPCLRLAYNLTLKSYAYQGSDCATRYSYICEMAENSASNEIKRLGRSRNILDEL